ncbi:MAG: carboxypeptidase regulatory-like domain-containing protein [Planctomycetota bacterium]
MTAPSPWKLRIRNSALLLALLAVALVWIEPWEGGPATPPPSTRANDGAPISQSIERGAEAARPEGASRRRRDTNVATGESARTQRGSSPSPAYARLIKRPVRGEVVTLLGEPVPNAHVTFDTVPMGKRDAVDATREQPRYPSVVTDQNGEFEIEAPFGWTIQLRASAPGFATGSSDSFAVAHRSPSTRTTLELTPAIALRGQVLDRTIGVGAAGVHVVATEFGAVTTTLEDGSFVLDGLPEPGEPTKVLLSAFAPGYKSANLNADLPSTWLQIDIEQEYATAFVVLDADSGQRLEAKIFARFESIGLEEKNPLFEGTDGEIRITQPDGSPREVVISSDRYESALVTTLPHRGPGVPTETIELTPSTLVEVRVSNPHGRPLAGALVRLLPGPGSLVSAYRSRRTSSTDENGVVRFLGAEAGSFNLGVQPDFRARDLAPKTVGPFVAANSPIQVQLDLGAVIRGRVTVPPNDWPNWSVSILGPAGAKSTTLEPDGSFRFATLPAGEYQVSAYRFEVSQLDGSIASIIHMSRPGSRTDSNRVFVSVGEEVEILPVIDLTGFADVEGVVSSNGRPYGPARVWMTAGTGIRFEGHVRESGEFRVRSVPHGTYELTVRQLGPEGPVLQTNVTIPSEPLDLVVR